MAKPPMSAALRKELRAKINARIELLNLTHASVARALSMTIPQVSRLVQDDDIFSLDRLVDAAARIGLFVRISATRAYGGRRAPNYNPKGTRNISPAA